MGWKGGGVQLSLYGFGEEIQEMKKNMNLRKTILESVSIILIIFFLTLSGNGAFNINKETTTIEFMVPFSGMYEKLSLLKTKFNW